jgi:acyl-CoA thioester hydrolase
MTAPDALLRLHRDKVRPEWLDYNGHMNEAFYLLVFSQATDAFMDHIALDDASRRRTNSSIYTLETHISYLQEVGRWAPVEVATQLLDLDDKRFHLFHVLHHGETGARLATTEMMLLNVDMAGPKAAPFRPEVRARLDQIFAAQKDLPQPKEAGRSIGIRR